MSYYDNQQWSAGAQQQQGWEQQTPPARSGMLTSVLGMVRVSFDMSAGASSAVPRVESNAFATQIEGTFIYRDERVADGVKEYRKSFRG